MKKRILKTNWANELWDRRRKLEIGFKIGHLDERRRPRDQEHPSQPYLVRDIKSLLKSQNT
jgi:hypothetical protein